MIAASTEDRLAAIEHLLSYCVACVMRPEQIAQDRAELADFRGIRLGNGGVGEESARSPGFIESLDRLLKAASEIERPA